MRIRTKLTSPPHKDKEMGFIERKQVAKEQLVPPEKREPRL